MQVAITGLGIFVPDHIEPESLFNSLYLGNSLLRSEKLSASTSVVSSSIKPKQLSRLDNIFLQFNRPDVSKTAKMALFCSHQAARAAKLDIAGLNQRIGLFLGINKNAPDPLLLLKLWKSSRGKTLSESEKKQIANELKTLRVTQVTEILAKELEISGIAMTHSDACTAGASAIVSGQRRIIAGELDVAICGAAEQGAHPLVQMHFDKLGASCQNTFSQPAMASRPFDKDRAGCILADGSAFIVLESVEHAKKRGVTPLAFLQGVARQSEAYKPTSTSPDGSLYKHCINQALANANITPDQIDHINAHGTSTVSNDCAEGAAISTLFRNNPSVTSTKSALGHSLAASGVIEAVLSVLCLIHQKVLPTLNYLEPKPTEAHLNIVTQGKKQTMNYILSNSFGFGGENSCLIFAKDGTNGSY